MPRILIVDDHPVVREGIGRVLTAAIPGVVLGVADNSVQALASMRTGVWNLVILDLALPGDDGNVVLRRLRQQHPAVPVLIMSMHPADQFARRSVQAGAVGYISKGSDPQELVRAVKAALAGGRYLPAEAQGAPEQHDHSGLPHEALSDREYQVLRMIGQGLTVSEIAAELSLSVKTVSTYRARILEKTRMRTNAELMRYVITHGLVPWPPS
jgi:two-component system, NarL family, invasion response regulator UvrY